MKINPQAANITQQEYLKNNTSLNSNNLEKTKENSNNALALNISSKKEPLSINNLSEIKEKITDISKRLDIDYSKDSANFSKNNINFYEGSFLTSQTTNLNISAINLISD